MRFAEQKKLKAVTFSYDDGMTQDIRLIELMNQYGLKGTFNLNSDKLGLNLIMERKDTGRRVARYRIQAKDLKYVYEGHEIAAHTLTHPILPNQEDAEVIRQVEQDRLQLSELAGYEVVGMAYPGGGGITHDDRVVELVRENTGIRYARTVTLTDSFDPQADLYRFRPNLHHIQDWDRMLELTRRFVEMEATTPQILYIWGHSYEMDFAWDRWQKLEELFAYLANRDDIFYGTNSEILL